MAEKNDIIITEQCVLPSGGNIYRNLDTPKMEITSMTIMHELKRLKPSEDVYKVLAEILDDCILTDIGMSSYDLCLGDFQYLIYRLRAATYGSAVRVVAMCPHCGLKSEVEINLDDFTPKEFTDADLKKYSKFKLPKCGKEIELRLQTPRMLDEVNKQTIEGRKKYKGLDLGKIYLIEQQIKTIDGDEPVPGFVTEWLKGLPMADINTIEQYATKLNSIIGVDSTFEYTCDHCGLDGKSIFNIDKNFFRPRIDI